jgi:hypothetical protein
MASSAAAGPGELPGTSAQAPLFDAARLLFTLLYQRQVCSINLQISSPPKQGTTRRQVRRKEGAPG